MFPFASPVQDKLKGERAEGGGRGVWGGGGFGERRVDFVQIFSLCVQELLPIFILLVNRYGGGVQRGSCWAIGKVCDFFSLSLTVQAMFIFFFLIRPLIGL